MNEKKHPSSVFRSFEVCLSFLTLFRFRSSDYPSIPEIGRSAWAFPLVGAVLGLGLAAFQFLLPTHTPGLLAGTLVVGLWVVLTGGLHLDGWADCCDALPTAVEPQRRNEIMKDSRIGTFGTLGVVLLVGLKIGSVASGNLPWFMLVLAATIGRGAMVLGAYKASNTGEGMAASFISGLDRNVATWAVLLCLGPIVVVGWKGLVVGTAAYLGTVWFRRVAEARLGTVNGDVLGATCELAETIVLVTAVMVYSGP